MKIDLAGHCALITGASSGIGAGTAQVLAESGASLVLAGRDIAALGLVADSVSAAVGTVSVVSADVTTGGGLDAIVDHVRSSVGTVDILVNNVGASMPTPIDATDEFWDDALALNFSAARKLSQAFISDMQKQRWGRIVNVSGSMEPRALNAASAAKAALHIWAKGLSCNVARDGVTVNCVAPGRIVSNQTMNKLHPDVTARQRFIDANIPIGRFGEGTDMGHAIAFLASEQASYITGAVLPVDGGMHYFAH